MEITDPLLDINPDNIQTKDASESIGASLEATTGQDLYVEEEYKDLFDDNLSSSIDPRFEDLRKLRAQSQSTVGQLANTAIKTLPQTLFSIAEQAGYILDFQAYDDIFRGLSNRISEDSAEHNYSDVDNWLSEFARNTNTTLDELLPVYRESPEKVWAPGDSAWWIDNISNLGESVAAFAATGFGVGKGLGMLAKGATRTISGAGNFLSTARAANMAQTGANIGTSVAVSYAEGMMTGVQAYDETYNRVKSELTEQASNLSKQERIDESLRPGDIEERAKQAAGQSAATTAGINTVTLPFLNYLSVSPLFRKGRKGRRMINRNLERSAVDTDVASYLSRVSSAEAAENFIGREAKEVAREAGLESVEELANEMAQTEGMHAGLAGEDMEEDKDFGERILSTLLTPEAALSATLGAIGGAAQQGIMRSLPMQEAEDGERISQRELEKRRHQEFVADEKQMLVDRLEQMRDAQNLIKQGEEEGDEAKVRKGMRMLQTEATADSISRGVQHQLVGLYEGIRNLTEEQAKAQGYVTDTDSPFYYKDIAKAEIDKINELSDLYEGYLNEYDFSAQEEFAGVPKALLAFKIQERNAEKNIEEFERLIKDREEYNEEINAQIDDFRLEERTKFIKERNDALEDLKAVLDRIDGGSRNLTLRDIVENEAGNLSSDRQRIIDALSNVDKDVFNEIYENTKDMDINAITDLINYSLAENNVRIKKANRREPYEDFLAQIEMEDGPEARKLFKDLKDLISEGTKKRIRDLEQLQNSQIFQKFAARGNFNYITKAKGRQELVDRTKEVFKKKRDSAIADASTSLRSQDTVEGVEEIMQDIPESLRKDLEPIAQDVKEEIKTKDRKNRNQKQEEESREIEEESQNKTEAKEKVDKDIDEQLTDAQQELRDMLDAGEGEVIGDDETTTDREDAQEILREAQRDEGEDLSIPPDEIFNALKDVIDNNHVKADNFGVDITSKIEDYLDSYYDVSQDVRDNLLERAKRYYKKQQELLKKDRQNQTTDNKEPKDTPPENKTRTKDKIEEEYPESSKKNPEKGHTVTYVSQEPVEFEGTLYNRTNERSDQQEFPLIELNEAVPVGTKLILKVGTETFDDNKRHVPLVEIEGQVNTRNLDVRNLSFDDLNISDKDVEEAVIEVYAIVDGDLEFQGYFPRTDSIREETTAQVDGVGDNVAKQKAINRRMRKDVILNVFKNDNTTPAEVESRTPGKLTKNFKTDENGNNILPLKKEFHSVANAFPGEKKFYVVRGQEPFVRGNQNVDKSNLMNKEDYFDDAEGSVGIIVTMGNGQELAIPLWIPKLRDTQDGSKLINTLYNLAKNREANALSAVGEVDLTDPNTLKTQIQNYVYTTSDGHYELHREEVAEDEQRRVYITVSQTDGHIRLIDQIAGTMHTTNPNDGDSTEGIYPFSENRVDKIKESLGRLNFNVDVDNINLPETMRRKRQRVVYEQGNYQTISYDNYNDFIAQYLETDIDGSYNIDYNGETHYLAYEHPSVRITTDTAWGDKQEVPDIPNRVDNTDIPNTETETQDTSDQEATEREEDVETDGDTNDTTSVQDTDSTTQISITQDQIEERLSNVINSRAMSNLVDFYDDLTDLLTATKEEMIDNVDQVGPATANMIMNAIDNLRSELSEQQVDDQTETIDQIIEDYDLADIPEVRNEIENILNSTLQEDINRLVELEDQSEDANMEMMGEYQRLSQSINDTIVEIGSTASFVSRVLNLSDQASTSIRQIENVSIAQAKLNRLQSRLDEINTSVAQSRDTESIKESIKQLKQLDYDANVQGEYDFADEVNDVIEDLEQEVVSRRETLDDTNEPLDEKINTEEETPGSDASDALDNMLGPNFQQPVEETPASEGALEQQSKNENISCNL